MKLLFRQWFMLFCLAGLFSAGCDYHDNGKPAGPPEEENYFIDLPPSIAKNEVLKVRFHCSDGLIAKIRESLAQKAVFNHDSRENIDIISRKVVWEISAESEDQLLFEKEHQVTQNDLDKLRELTETVNVWGSQEAQPKVGRTIWIKVEFEYFYETVYNEKQSKILFSTSTGIPYTTRKLTHRKPDSSGFSIEKFFKMVEGFDTLSLQAGFIIGVALVLVLAVLAKLLELTHGGSKLQGIAIQCLNGTTVVSSNAIRSIIKSDVLSIPSLRLNRFRLLRKGKKPVIYLVVSYGFKETFPEASGKLREMIKASLQEKLGIDNISEIDIHLEEEPQTKSQKMK